MDITILLKSRCGLKTGPISLTYLVKSYRHCDVDAGDKRREVKQSLQRRLLLFLCAGKMMSMASQECFSHAFMPWQITE
ncbi:TPA: hypothetical protein L9M30_000800 [Klebsiella pneumoniae]|nr:hypothetical protein [Klebsiella pneumoniae]